MKKKVWGYSLLILLTATFFFTNSAVLSSINKVCAQSDYGEECKDNYAECPVGQTNLLQLVQDGQINLSNNLQRTELINSIAHTYDNNGARNSCVASRYSDFMVRIMTKDEYNNVQYDNPVGEFFGVGGHSTSTVKNQNADPIDWGNDFNDYKVIPRICPIGWHSQDGANTVLGRDNVAEKLATFHLQGCCPTGFTFVNTNSDWDEFFQGGQALQAGVCCRTSKGPFTHWDHEKGCMNGDTIQVNNSEQIDHEHNSLQEALVDMEENANIIIAVNQNDNFKTKVNTDSLGGKIKPQFGLGLGEDFPGDIVTILPSNGSDRVCPKGTTCAVASNTDILEGNIIDASLFKSTPDLTCGKCFIDNVPMVTIQDTTDRTKYLLRYCDKNSQTLYRDEEMIGSPDITNGALLIDPANRPAYIACFKSGGLYTSIGCVDPTPKGIVTGVIRIALGVMGGVALLQLIYVGILYQAGQEDKIRKAKGLLMATLAGLTVLVLSVLILRIIGVNILDVLPQGSV